jgi:hypothetical protein
MTRKPKPTGQEWHNAITATMLANSIRPLFAGQSPDIIGAVLADLLATLLAGHGLNGDQKRTGELREKILLLHMEYVRKLIPVNEQAILEREAEHATRQ